MSRSATSEAGSLPKTTVWLAIIERVIITAWVGALWAIGYLVAPVLFASLEDRSLAGLLAGRMFTKVAYLSVAAAIVLLVTHWRQGWRLCGWRSLTVVAMLVLIVIGELWVRPLMAAATAPAFGRLHGIAQIIYLIVSLLGLLLVTLQGRAERRA